MSNDLPETQGMTDAQLQAQPNVVSPTNSRKPKSNNYNRGRYGVKKLVGDIVELEDSVFVTAEENKDRKYSHRNTKRRIKSLITQTLKGGHNDFRKMWDGVKDPEVAIPDPEIPASLLIDDPTTADEIRYTAQSKNNEVRRENFLNNLSLSWDIIWGQCSLNMRNKLMVDEDFDTALEQADCVWLLKKTRHNSLSFLTEKYDVASVLEGERELISVKQGGRSLAEYRDHFKETFEAVEYSNGQIGVAPALILS
jgi:hypothetical protein